MSLNLNKVMIAGRLTRDPELRFTPSNTPVVDVGLAMDGERRKTAAGEYEDGPPVFVDVTVWGKQAESLDKFFSKGDPIFFDGRLEYEQWEDKATGQKRSKLKVVAFRWQFVESKGDGQPRENRSAAAPTGSAGGAWDNVGQHEAVLDDDIPFAPVREAW